MNDEAGVYFSGRAESELAAGRAAEHPEAARAHFLLAGYYLDRVYNVDAGGWSDDRAAG